MTNKPHILYISILGMSEPLGKSQVLEYLKTLAKDFNISLYSFEKDTSSEMISSLRNTMNENNINWQFQSYTNRFGVFSTIYQIITSLFTLAMFINNNNALIIHARSLIPILIALPLKYVMGVKIIFDIRGFQTDEKAEVGRISHGGFLYKLLKFLEKEAYKRSDVIVSLTYSAKDIIAQVTDENKIIVIPTCANADVFKLCDTSNLKEQYGYENSDRVFVHVGAVGNWYDFDSELKLLISLMNIDENIKFLVINKGEHELIQSKLEQYKLEKGKVRIIESDFYEVYKYLNLAEASLFIIKPSYSKKASAPTKFAENLCCELFSITNDDIGDMDHFIKQYPDVGFSFPKDTIESDVDNLARAILQRLECRNKNSGQFKELYEESMSNIIAVKKYSDIYKQLSGNL